MLLQILISFLFCLILVSQESQASCRSLEFMTILKGKALTNHKIRSIQQIRDDQTCKTKCYMEPLCFAVNFCRKPDGSEAVCDLLNNTATIVHDQDLVQRQECNIHISKSSCSSSPCSNHASCLGDFLGDPVPYKCVCPAGFTGQFCQSDIDECALNTNDCSPNAFCVNVFGSYKCTCKTGYQGDGKSCQDINECTSNTHNRSNVIYCNNTIGGYNCIYPKSCAEVISFVPNRTHGFYPIEAIPGEMHRTYCFYSSIPGCGAGPWVMALKIDGTKSTGEYDKPLWTDQRTINPESFTNIFDDNSEIKLPAYWSHPVSRVCIGIKYSDALNWIAVDISAPTLYSLFTAGQERITNLGRNTWTSLLSSYRLDHYCNKEGLNVVCGGMSTRIGLLANNENDCSSCDGAIGLGIKFHNMLSCGNVRFSQQKNAFCYVVIQ